MKRRARASLPWLATGAVALAVCCALVWPLPLQLTSAHWLSAFGDSHTWVFATNGKRLFDGTLLEATCAAGYPQPRTMATLAWLPNLVFLGLQPLLGAIGAGNVVQLLSLPASALAAGVLIRRWTDAGPWLAAGLGLVYGLCPTLLATFSGGEVPNTQAWLFPMFLLALDAAGRRAWWSPAVAAASLVAAFTSPYYAAALPLVTGAWCLARARGAWLDRDRLRDGLAAVASVALLPLAWLYYGAGDPGGPSSVFQPALQPVVQLGSVPFPPPVAQPDAWLWPFPAGTTGDVEVAHVVYLGLILVAVAAVGAWRGGRGRRRGASLAIAGAVLSAGPWLAAFGSYHGVFGWRVPLPVSLLEAIGYPTSMGGLYYRFTVVLALGLCVLAAPALVGRAGWLVALVVALQVGDSVRAAGAWPRPVEAVPVAWLLELGGDDGAVLDLPLPRERTEPGEGQRALLRAAVHGRPTTAAPRGFSAAATRDVRASVTQALGGGGPESLRRAGYRWVVLDHAAPGPGPARARLVAALGEPEGRGALELWDLGPTSLDQRCTGGPQPKRLRSRR